jgi:hypothetical protein
MTFLLEGSSGGPILVSVMVVDTVMKTGTGRAGTRLNMLRTRFIPRPVLERTVNS